MPDIYSPTEHDAISLEELSLYHLITNYRAENGLAAIPLSVGLSATAGRHVIDTRENIWAAGLELPAGANLHSWSDAPYFSDHSEPQRMWFAPDRLGTGYLDYSYEISGAGYQDIAGALVGWQNSPGHNDIILNQGIWTSQDWSAIGVGVISDFDSGLDYGGRIYHVWFGAAEDPGGVPTIMDGATDDRIYATTFDDVISHSQGQDLILGRSGEDIIFLSGDERHTSDYVAFNVSSDTQVGTQARISLDGLVRIEAVVDGGTDADIIQLTDDGDAFFLHDAFSGFHSAVTLSDDYAGNESAARFSNIEEIRGMGGDDIIDLTSPDYSLAGVAMTIDAGQGNDVVWGSDADENISGGTGNDTIFGGIGTDVLTGDLGADVFEFTRTSVDTSVTDFDLGQGDTLRFYNTGGATFSSASVALTAVGITLSYVDTGSGTEHDISIALATSAADFTATLPQIVDAIEIIA